MLTCCRLFWQQGEYFACDDTSDGERCCGCGGWGVADMDDVAIDPDVEVVEQFAVAVTCLCTNTGTAGFEMLCLYVGNEFLQCASKSGLTE